MRKPSEPGRALVLTALLAAMLGSVASAGAVEPRTSDEFDRIAVGGLRLAIPDSGAIAAVEGSHPTLARLQVLMDRAGISPGVIDGRDTERLRLAFTVFSALDAGRAIASPHDTAGIDAALESSGRPAFVSYTITAADVAGPFTPDLPELYIHQASLNEIGFRDVREMLAERFHMDEAYLAALNPQAEFDRVGTVVTVADPGRYLQRRIVRVEADKAALQLRAYDAEGRLVAAYPASIGSAQTPSPSGTHLVRNKAQDPQYTTFDSIEATLTGQTEGPILLPPGPNGPVGNAWIGLSKRGYGIHGTPEPSRVGIAESAGCIRLTNWDALELARLVRRGVKVTFVD